MKKNVFPLIIISFLAASCGSGDADYDASGVFETTEVVVSAKAQGEIKCLLFEEGQTVAAGDTLGLIDVKQLSLKKQQLISTRKATDDKKLDPSNQVASIRQQIANAQKEKERFAALARENAATQKEVDDISYQISVLQQQLSAALESVNSSNVSLASQSESIDRQISTVDEQISDAIIMSPIAGTILTKYAEQGEYATPGRALFKVANVKEMKIRIYVSADQLTTLKIGQEVRVYADIGKDDRKEYKGRVTWISEKAEFTPKTIQTRDERANLVYAVKVSFDNDGLVKTGMYGDVKF